MKEISPHYLYETESNPHLTRSYDSILAEPLEILQISSDKLVKKWTELYLSTFGRRAFFSSERVEGLFQEMVSVFIDSLKSSNLDYYFETLRAKGKFFSALDVPFEEVILCLQLFEEAYLSILLANGRNVGSALKEVLLAFEEFNNISTAVFAVSYFRSAKRGWQEKHKDSQEENEKLMQELQSMHEELFTSTQNHIASMELLVSGINRKLRKSVIQSRRIQKFTEVLDQDPSIKNLLRIADKFLKQGLPDGSGIIYGIFDENQRRLSIYSKYGSGDFEEECLPLLEEVFFSELPFEYQEVLFNEEKKHLLIHDPNLLPRFLSEKQAFDDFGDFLYLPLKKYNDTLGFIWMASKQRNIFTKQSIKFHQRLCRVLSNAIFNNVYYSRHKKHSEFISMLDQLEDRVLQRHSLEATLDYCLGAMIDLLEVERASLMLLDKKKKTLSIYAAKGFKVFPFSGLILKWGEGIAGWCIKEGKAISIPRMRDAKQRRDNALLGKFLEMGSTQVNLNVRSLLCVPLYQMNEPIGVINLSTLNYHKHFEQSEIDMIQRFAQRVSQALKSLVTVKDLESYIRRSSPRR